MTSSDVAFANFHTPENPEFYARNMYRKLDEERADFRFLELLPGGKDDVVKCQLIQSSKDLKYEALSYCAGDPKDTREILVNGYAFNVFASLFGALIVLRDPSESRIVWIDQICINQNDPIERNHQVGKMKNVYQNAERVVAWLGHIQDGRLAFDAIRDFHDAYAQKVALLQEGFPSPRALEDSEIVMIEESIADECRKELDLEKGGGPLKNKLKALGHLFASQLWARMWVWQELILARSIQFLCNDASINLKSFIMTIDILTKLIYLRLFDRIDADGAVEEQDIIPGNFNYLVTIFLSRHIVRLGATLDLMYLLEHSRRAKSSDPRDRVYALCGIISPDYKLAPDYTETVSFAYSHATWSIISVTKSLNVLIFCEPPDPQCSSILPTWCPDWSTPETTLPPSGAGVHPRYLSRYRACGKLTGETSLHRYEEGESLIYELNFHGLIIGRVEELAEYPPSDVSFSDLLESWLAMISKKRPMSESLREELHMAVTFDIRGPSSSVEKHEPLRYEKYMRMKIVLSLSYRRYFVSEKGLIGLTRPHASCGDVICVLPGTLVPFVLRNKGGFYTVVGEAYVSDGYMKGRAYDEMENGEIPLVHFKLR